MNKISFPFDNVISFLVSSGFLCLVLFSFFKKQKCTAIFFSTRCNNHIKKNCIIFIEMVNCRIPCMTLSAVPWYIMYTFWMGPAMYLYVLSNYFDHQSAIRVCTKMHQSANVSLQQLYLYLASCQ